MADDALNRLLPWGEFRVELAGVLSGQERNMPTFTLSNNKTLESLLDELTDAAGRKVAEFYGGDDAHPDLKDDIRRALKGVLRRNVRLTDEGPEDEGTDQPRRNGNATGSRPAEGSH